MQDCNNSQKLLKGRSSKVNKELTQNNVFTDIFEGCTVTTNCTKDEVLRLNEISPVEKKNYNPDTSNFDNFKLCNDGECNSIPIFGHIIRTHTHKAKKSKDVEEQSYQEVSLREVSKSFNIPVESLKAGYKLKGCPTKSDYGRLEHIIPIIVLTSKDPIYEDTLNRLGYSSSFNNNEAHDLDSLFRSTNVKRKDITITINKVPNIEIEGGVKKYLVIKVPVKLSENIKTQRVLKASIGILSNTAKNWNSKISETLVVKEKSKNTNGKTITTEKEVKVYNVKIIEIPITANAQIIYDFISTRNIKSLNLNDAKVKQLKIENINTLKSEFKTIDSLLKSKEFLDKAEEIRKEVEQNKKLKNKSKNDEQIKANVKLDDEEEEEKSKEKKEKPKKNLSKAEVKKPIQEMNCDDEEDDLENELNNEEVEESW